MELQVVKGIGQDYAKKLNALNIYNVNDLLEYYPYRYNFINITPIANINETDSWMIKAQVIDSPRVQYIKRNFNRLNFKALRNAF